MARPADVLAAEAKANAVLQKVPPPGKIDNALLQAAKVLRVGAAQMRLTEKRRCEGRIRQLGRAPRRPTNAHKRGSRRTPSRSAGGGSSGDPDSDEPPGGRHHDLALSGVRR